MSTQDIMKQQAAQAALSYVKYDAIIGVGSGSTINYFIEALQTIKGRIAGAVASSIETERRLKKHGIPVYDLNSVDSVAVYIDGADEFNDHRYLVKGGGGALTREKIIAAAAQQFICIVDETKHVDILGKFPVAIEVINMARGYVGRSILQLQGDPEYRLGFTTDNGHIIIDVHNLTITDPIKLESQFNNIVGTVANGLFAKRPADKLVIAHKNGTITHN